MVGSRDLSNFCEIRAAMPSVAPGGSRTYSLTFLNGFQSSKTEAFVETG